MMTETIWKVFFEDAAYKSFKKLDRHSQKKIQHFIRERLETQEDPRRFGKSLTYHLEGYWRYRVEDFRLICVIEDKRLIVAIVGLGHRQDVYN